LTGKFSDSPLMNACGGVGTSRIRGTLEERLFLHKMMEDREKKLFEKKKRKGNRFSPAAQRKKGGDPDEAVKNKKKRRVMR